MSYSYSKTEDGVILREDNDSDTLSVRKLVNGRWVPLDRFDGITAGDLLRSSVISSEEEIKKFPK